MKIKFLLLIAISAVFFFVSCKSVPHENVPVLSAAEISAEALPVPEAKESVPASSSEKRDTVAVVASEVQSPAIEEPVSEPVVSAPEVQEPVEASVSEKEDAVRKTEVSVQTEKKEREALVASESEQAQQAVQSAASETEQAGIGSLGQNRPADKSVEVTAVEPAAVETLKSTGEQSAFTASDETRIPGKTEIVAGKADFPPNAEKTESAAVQEYEAGPFFAEPEVATVTETAVKSEDKANEAEAENAAEVGGAAEYKTETETEGNTQTEIPVVPKRFVTAKRNQFIDIPFAGKNWIFLGETEASEPPVVRFVKRTFSENDTLFSLQAKSSGKTVLHFCKRDVLEDAYIDEYVAVEVTDEVLTGKERVSVQAVSATVPSDQTGVFPLSEENTSGTTTADLTETVQAGTASTVSDNTQTQNAEELYTKAQNAFDEKRFADSLDLLEKYEAAPQAELDKALFLRGRIYESDSAVRNIRAALTAYEKIVSSFPESGVWNEAKKRTTYIKRFYFDIR